MLYVFYRRGECFKKSGVSCSTSNFSGMKRSPSIMKPFFLPTRLLSQEALVQWWLRRKRLLSSSPRHHLVLRSPEPATHRLATTLSHCSPRYVGVGHKSNFCNKTPIWKIMPRLSYVDRNSMTFFSWRIQNILAQCKTREVFFFYSICFIFTPSNCIHILHKLMGKRTDPHVP